MKTLSILIFFVAVNIFAFDSGHDSLLFDGSENYEFPKNTGCTIRLTVYYNVEITSFSMIKTLSCGEVSYEKQSIKQTIQRDMDIPVGSEVSTGPDGYAVIELEDGSRILMDNNSKITIEEDFCIRHPLLRFRRGSIWTTFKKLLGVEGNYAVETGLANGGARGTEFEVITDENKTTFKVYEGQVEVTPMMNDKTNKLLIKAYEQLIKNMETGKITAEEYEEKTIRWNEIMEGSRQFPSVMVEAGNMVDVTFEVSEIKTIPADNNKWFEDPKYNK